MLWLATAAIVLWAAELVGVPIYLRHAAIEELNQLGEVEIAEDTVSFSATGFDQKSVDRLVVLFRRLRCTSVTVSLGEARVSDLSPLAGLNGLTTLYLYGTPVIGLSPLAGLKKLESITLRKNQEVRVPVSLEKAITRL